MNIYETIGWVWITTGTTLFTCWFFYCAWVGFRSILGSRLGQAKSEVEVVRVSSSAEDIVERVVANNRVWENKVQGNE